MAGRYICQGAVHCIQERGREGGRSAAQIIPIGDGMPMWLAQRSSSHSLYSKQPNQKVCLSPVPQDFGKMILKTV